LEIRRAKRLMRPEEFAAEFLCSWSAAQRGAYYAAMMELCDTQGRIGAVPWDSSYPVSAAVDLGWSDGMACTFWQHIGGQHRCLKGMEFHQTTIPEVVAAWRKLPFPIEKVVLPHDALQHGLATGQTREEVFHSLGCETVIAERLSPAEGIEMFRQVLKTAVFDRDGTGDFVEALRAYHSSYDEVRGVHSVKAVHDWSSHYADSGRYYAVGRPGDLLLGTQRAGVFGTYV